MTEIVAAIASCGYYAWLNLNAVWLGRSDKVHWEGYRSRAMRYLAAILSLVLLTAIAPVAEAQPFPRGGDGGQVQSLDSIIFNIRRSFPGQVSDVQGPFGGRFRVKWLTPDGRVLWIDADARTGRILGVEGGGGGPRNFGPPNFMDRGQPLPPQDGYIDDGPPYGRQQWDDADGYPDRPRRRFFGR